MNIFSISCFLLSTVAFRSCDVENTDNAKLSEELYTKLFKIRRVEQLEAVKSIRKITHYEQQYKLIVMMAEKVFTVIQLSRAQIESSSYIPGISPFPTEDLTKDALSNILENTALFSEVLLRLPDITTSVLKINNNWDVLLQWSISFSHQVKYLLDNSTIKLLNLVSQELNHTEQRDPNYINPYRKINENKQQREDDFIKAEKKKKRKDLKKGPKLHEL